MTEYLNPQNLPLLSPLTLVDLDDTLFQTHRRIRPQDDFQAITVDQQGQALAYMSAPQQHFVQWLLQTTDVIPVTARSAEALSRVHLKFHLGAVCSHGGTILNPDLTLNVAWQQHMHEVLASYQVRQQHLMDILQEKSQQFGEIRTWTVQEQGLGLYVVAKQKTPDDSPYAPTFLPKLLNSLAAELLEGFYFHLNGNNLALIPQPVSKANAVKFLLQNMDLQQRPIIGFGDSLSDVGFLNQCHWWGMPQHSQLNRWVQHNLNQQYCKEGYYGDYQ